MYEVETVAVRCDSTVRRKEFMLVVKRAANALADLCRYR